MNMPFLNVRRFSERFVALNRKIGSGKIAVIPRKTKNEGGFEQDSEHSFEQDPEHSSEQDSK